MTTPRACAYCNQPIPPKKRRDTVYCSPLCLITARNRRAGFKPHPPAEERFWAKVREDETGCWLWTGHRNRKGYGRFRTGGMLLYAHRWSYEHMVAPIPDGLQIDHLCAVTSCVRPDHLDVVTNAINMARRFEMERDARLRSSALEVEPG